MVSALSTTRIGAGWPKRSGIKAAVLAAFLGLGTAGPVWAHAHLASAVPPVDSTVRTAPAQITITFTERLERNLSRITVKDAAGVQVDKGDSAVSAGDAKVIAVSLKDIPPGTYSVSWTATSVDTHRTTGEFKFTVRP